MSTQVATATLTNGVNGVNGASKKTKSKNQLRRQKAKQKKAEEKEQSETPVRPCPFSTFRLVVHMRVCFDSGNEWSEGR